MNEGDLMWSYATSSFWVMTANSTLPVYWALEAMERAASTTPVFLACHERKAGKILPIRVSNTVFMF